MRACHNHFVVYMLCWLAGRDRRGRPIWGSAERCRDCGELVPLGPANDRRVG